MRLAKHFTAIRSPLSGSQEIQFDDISISISSVRDSLATGTIIGYTKLEYTDINTDDSVNIQGENYRVYLCRDVGDLKTDSILYCISISVDEEQDLEFIGVVPDRIKFFEPTNQSISKKSIRRGRRYPLGRIVADVAVLGVVVAGLCYFSTRNVNNSDISVAVNDTQTKESIEDTESVNEDLSESKTYEYGSPDADATLADSDTYIEDTRTDEAKYNEKIEKAKEKDEDSSVVESNKDAEQKEKKVDITALKKKSDEIVKEDGVSDPDTYAVIPGHSPALCSIGVVSVSKDFPNYTFRNSNEFGYQLRFTIKGKGINWDSGVLEPGKEKTVNLYDLVGGKTMDLTISQKVSVDYSDFSMYDGDSITDGEVDLIDEEPFDYVSYDGLEIKEEFTVSVVD